MFGSKAQVNSGRYLLGGSFSTYNFKNIQILQNSKNNSLSANLQVGKVVKENTVVGVILSYSYSNNYFSAPSDSNKVNHFGAGVFFRKYKKLAKDFYFFGEMNASYDHTNYRQTYLQNSSQGFKSVSDGGSASLIPGLSYAICERLQIELVMPGIIGLSYSHYKTDYLGNPPLFPNQKGSIFSMNTNLNSNLLSNFGIGFKFLLGKKISTARLDKLPSGPPSTVNSPQTSIPNLNLIDTIGFNILEGVGGLWTVDS
jgi:hypothetical protein